MSAGKPQKLRTNLATCSSSKILPARSPTPPSPAERATAQAAERRRLARKQIIRTVEDCIQRETSGREAEALHAELYERLETIDADDDIETLPVAEIIALIRRDLGIANLPRHPSLEAAPARRRARALRPRRKAQDIPALVRSCPRPRSRARLRRPGPPGPAPARRDPDPAPRPQRLQAGPISVHSDWYKSANDSRPLRSRFQRLLRREPRRLSLFRLACELR